MTVKNRNKELMLRLLNLQASITKHNSNNRRSKHEKEYITTMEKIREKSYAIREKLVKLRHMSRPRNRVSGSES
jgi:uncharacterized protein with WD repeat